MDNAPILLLIVGPSGAGKTTLIEKLITALSAKGIRTGAIKRSHHDVEFDQPGKDSHRFSTAGANPVALVSDQVFAFIERGATSPTLVEAARLFVEKADIVLVEGYKTEGAQRLCFLENKGGDTGDDDLTLGYITTDGEAGNKGSKPLFDRNDTEKIAGWIAGLLKTKSGDKR